MHPALVTRFSCARRPPAGLVLESGSDGVDFPANSADVGVCVVEQPGDMCGICVHERPFSSVVFGRGWVADAGHCAETVRRWCPAPLWEGVRSGVRIDEINDLGACFVQRATHSQSFDASRLRPATTTSRWASRQSPRCASNAPIPRAAQTEHRVHVVHDVVGDDRVYRPGHLRHPLASAYDAGGMTPGAQNSCHHRNGH